MNDRQSKIGLLGYVLLSGMILVPCLRAALPAQESSEEEKRVEEAILVFQEIAGLTDEGIPESILGKAHR
jgi:hypothetical protein